MAKQKEPVVSVRLPAELDQRLIEAAKKLDLSKNDIARHAIRAAVKAIEEDGYRLQLPMEMQVKKGPLQSRPLRPSEKIKEVLGDIGSTQRSDLNETPADHYSGARPKPSSKKS